MKRTHRYVFTACHFGPRSIESARAPSSTPSAPSKPSSSPAAHPHELCLDSSSAGIDAKQLACEPHPDGQTDRVVSLSVTLSSFLRVGAAAEGELKETHGTETI